jgi:ribose transport system substrate-binding protein
MKFPSSIRTRVRGRGARLAAVATIAAAALLTAGCSSGSPAGGSTADGKVSVGMINFDLSAAAATSEAKATQAALKKEGWSVLFQDAGGNATNANATCQQYVTRKVSAIVIGALQIDQMAQCMSVAKTAGIPVFYIDSFLAAGMAGAISTATPSGVNDRFIKDQADKKNLRVLFIQYSANSGSLARTNDLLKKMKKAGIDPDKVVQQHEVKVPGQVQDSTAATAAWLNAHPASAGETLVIWTVFTDAAVGALAALKQAGRQVPIYTWDLTQPSVAPLQSGEFVVTSLADTAGIGKQMVGMIKDYLGGDTKPKQLMAPAILLDKSTVDAYIKDHPDAVVG